MNIEEFKKEYCINCKEKCERGIVQTYQIIRCNDRDIVEPKEENIK